MIKLLFFAQLQEQMGQHSFEIEGANYTVQRLKEFLLKEYPMINLQHSMVAINEQFSSDNDLVQDGDIVAFLPPVSGG
ncbi:molybdopterin synthase sulfur carrier subunit [Lysinibacillus sp. PLM2]|nr:molybdopterin synthase sulfur carrier subunit [Lysinibacillus sp. PLM2]